MSWMVTGGAGYIGAHVVRAFEEVGLDVVVVDDLSSGHREFVHDDVPFVEGSIVDTDLMERAMKEHDVEGVVHLAGFKYAGVSVNRPLHTYTQNVTGTVNLLEAMERTGADKMVFSSSAATFGTPDVDLVTEETETHPESPYGESKLIGEWLIRDQAVATGLRHTSLRYFNVVGSGTDDLYDTSPHNLFPIVFDKLLAGRHRGSTATTTTPPTAPACATTCTSPTSPSPTSRPPSGCRPARSCCPVYNLGSGTGAPSRRS